MSVVQSRDVDRALLKKGFRREDRGDRFYYLYAGGRKREIFTFMSHTSNMDLGDSLIGKMSKQLCLTKRQFLELVKCTMTGEAYLELLVKAGELRQ